MSNAQLLFLAVVTFVVALLAGVSFGYNHAPESGMCDDTITAVTKLATAPDEEIPAALNAVYETDMRCRTK